MARVLLLAAAGACLLATSPARAQLTGRITILASDARGITIEYRPALTRRTIGSGAAAMTAYVLDGGIRPGSMQAGEPDLPLYSHPLVVRGLAGNSVMVLEDDYHTDRDVVVPPVPSVRIDGGVAEERLVTGPAYSSAGFQPASIARLREPGIARDQMLASLEVHVVQYDPVLRVARVHDRIVVRVTYGPPHPALTSAAGDAAFQVDAINADQAGRWRLRQPAARKAAISQLATGSWYRIETTEEGMYRLPLSWFSAAGIDIAAVDPRTIRMFGSGGRELPPDPDALRPADLQEIAILVHGEADGRFDEGDYVEFYGRGLSGFVYDSIAGRFRHYIHRFDNANSWLLTFGGATGKRMQGQPSLSMPAPMQPAFFLGKDFVEEEVNNLLLSGKLWLSKKLTAGLGSANQIIYSRKLTGYVEGQPVQYRVQLYSASDRQTSNSFTLSDNGTTIGIVPMGTVDFDTDRDDIAASSGERFLTSRGAIVDDRSNLTIAYSCSNPDRNRGGYVDWVEWYYARRFEPVNDVLAFTSPDTTATVEYAINGFSMSDIHVYDITNHADVRRIDGASISGGTLRFQAAVVERSPRSYFSYAATAFRTPGAPSKVENSTLLGTDGAEFIIIAPRAFLAAAERLKAHRESSTPAMKTRVVVLPDIYTEFNSGVKDPTAIRNFLVHALRSWTPAPKYVLLLGDGHYDYKGYTTREEIQIPVWESENSINLLACYVTDDYYACVAGSDRRVDLGLGRLPVMSASEADDAVSKIIHYESGMDFGGWRNRVCFVADDGLTTRGDDMNTHTQQSETLAAGLPPDIEQKKIYIISYPTENTAQGRRKPDANRAIIDQINEGCVVMNYTGHGSESVWAHEQVLVSDVSIPQMRNTDRLTFVTAATCTFGLYDHPNLRSGMEMMLIKPDGGAIGALCSPRVVISGQNSVFNESFFNTTFLKGRDDAGRVKPISTSVWATKQTLYGDPGYEKFHLFCDPTVRLLLPRFRGSLDSIVVNGQRVATGRAQLRALSKVTMHASVLQPDSSVWADFNGTAQASLFDAERHVPIPEWNNWSYVQPGGLLFNGKATIRNGQFAVSFIVPKDISYENATGRFALYFDDAREDGAGYSIDLTVGGSDSTASPDGKGPDIDLFLDSRAFQPGDVVNERPRLIVDLFDEHGINMTGLGIGHSIECRLDKSDRSIVLNSYFTGDVDSYQKGSVEYQLDGLAPGMHTATVRAWDIYNNSTTAETMFRVVNSARLALEQVVPYPNPMTDATAFTFQHNQSVAVNADVRVYTIAGRQIRKLTASSVTDRFIQIPWDGRDEDGDRAANGIYFYRVTVETVDGSLHAESTGKVAIAR